MRNPFFAQNRKYLAPCAIDTTSDPRWNESEDYGIDIYRIEIYPAGYVTDTFVRTGKSGLAMMFTTQVSVSDPTKQIAVYFNSTDTNAQWYETNLNFGMALKAVRDATDIEKRYWDGEVITNVYQDGSGNWYNGVKIGNLIWIVGYIQAGHYQNGTPIPIADEGIEWTNITTPAYTYIVVNDSSRFYNGHAVRTGNIVSGNGWRIPTLDDYVALFQTVTQTLEYTQATALKSCRQVNHPLA